MVPAEKHLSDITVLMVMDPSVPESNHLQSSWSRIFRDSLRRYSQNLVFGYTVVTWNCFLQTSRSISP